MPLHVRLLVADAARAASVYEALGFERIHADPVFVHLRWARYADVFLVAQPPGMGLPSRGAGVLLCFAAVEVDLETIAARAQAAGLRAEGPQAQPWHTRELTVADADGYRLVFTAPA